MIIDSGWDFLSLARLRWPDDLGSGDRQFVVFGDHHWWFYGVADVFGDRWAHPEEWVDEVLNTVDSDMVRYLAVVLESVNTSLDYSLDAYPFDRMLRAKAAERGLHHMGCYFIGNEYWSATGPMKTFATYVGSEQYPTVTVEVATTTPGSSAMHA
ncbi:hypothetical protein MIC448_350029 [Microbacterium sp. C448]|uniref:hypothetical protein n=1 Tax=Microbacterium TaxID=33882 RepID=UPI0003DE5DDA|nr:MULTISPECIES: hypothetical protein [Microbacterium]MDO8382756.1 hypothetical protein [Microbacterium sp.]CDK00858.1 hypothetical protein MIC448_350029 [Microbacterium sp. C448]|tara:strand:- start:2104 stop:2568 length:465 start_codon:yes stop_codon:yes gene_type:complete